VRAFFVINVCFFWHSPCFLAPGMRAEIVRFDWPRALETKWHPWTEII